jgi:hypothetical protein
MKTSVSFSVPFLEETCRGEGGDILGKCETYRGRSKEKDKTVFAMC